MKNNNPEYTENSSKNQFIAKIEFYPGWNSYTEMQTTNYGIP